MRGYGRLNRKFQGDIVHRRWFRESPGSSVGIGFKLDLESVKQGKTSGFDAKLRGKP